MWFLFQNLIEFVNSIYKIIPLFITKGYHLKKNHFGGSFFMYFFAHKFSNFSRYKKMLKKINKPILYTYKGEFYKLVLFNTGNTFRNIWYYVFKTIKRFYSFIPIIRSNNFLWPMFFIFILCTKNNGRKYCLCNMGSIWYFIN